MGTNGACHCLDGLHPNQRIVVKKALRLLRTDVTLMRQADFAQRVRNGSFEAAAQTIREIEAEKNRLRIALEYIADCLPAGSIYPDTGLFHLF